MSVGTDGASKQYLFIVTQYDGRDLRSIVEIVDDKDACHERATEVCVGIQGICADSGSLEWKYLFEEAERQIQRHGIEYEELDFHPDEPVIYPSDEP